MKTTDAITLDEVRALFEFRYSLRLFLRASENIVATAKLRPQQHQLMLAIKSMPDPEDATISALAECLLLKPHSVVELADRLSTNGLVRRRRSEKDHRLVFLTLTAKGERVFNRMASMHRDELQHTGPALVKALGSVLK